MLQPASWHHNEIHALLASPAILCSKIWVATMQLADYVNGLGLQYVLSAERKVTIMLHMHDPVSCNIHTTISIAIIICPWVLNMFTLHGCIDSRSGAEQTKLDM